MCHYAGESSSQLDTGQFPLDCTGQGVTCSSGRRAGRAVLGLAGLCRWIQLLWGLLGLVCFYRLWGAQVRGTGSWGRRCCLGGLSCCRCCGLWLLHMMTMLLVL